MTHSPEPPTTGLAGDWRHWLGLVGLLVIAVAGLDYRWVPAAAINPPTTNTVSASPPDKLPDILVEQPVIDEFDAEGHGGRKLQGELLRHFEAEKYSEIVNPTVMFEQQKTGAKPSPWYMTAQFATLTHASNQINLQGDVVLWSDATSAGRTEIRTEQLVIDTARQFAETGKTVNIRAGHSQATAAGLKADLANERLLLPSRVKEIHEVRR